MDYSDDVLRSHLYFIIIPYIRESLSNEQPRDYNVVCLIAVLRCWREVCDNKNVVAVPVKAPYAMPSKIRAANSIQTFWLPMKSNVDAMDSQMLMRRTFFNPQELPLALIPSYVKNVIHSSNLSLAGVLVFILLGVAALIQFFPWVQNPVKRMRKYDSA